MWARVHKIDRVRPQPGGSAIVLIEDSRNAAEMSRVPGLSTVIAIARILAARRVIELKFSGRGEVRYASAAMPPGFLLDAITRSGASASDASGDHVRMAAVPPGAIAPIIDHAFAQLAHHVRTNHRAADMIGAVRLLEAARRASPFDRETHPIAYWVAVFELSALAGELSRPHGGRWVETAETPVPFAIRFSTGALATPAKLAQRIVEGRGSDAELAGDELAHLGVAARDAKAE